MTVLVLCFLGSLLVMLRATREFIPLESYQDAVFAGALLEVLFLASLPCTQLLCLHALLT